MIGLASGIFASASYTAASFVASLASVAIIAAGISTDERAGLFLFLALYSPLTTMMSQRRLLAIYQSSKSGRKVSFSEEIATFSLFSIFIAFFTDDYYSVPEAVALAGTVLCQIHSASAAGSIQHRTNNALGWSVAVLATAAVRICATWLGLDHGPVIAFAAGSYAYLLAMLSLQALVQRKAAKAALVHDRRAIDEKADAEPWRERLATFAFFSVGAITFQMDKYALDGAGQTASVAQSGAITILLLSPISLIFATLYRTKTKVLFSTELSLAAKIPAVSSIAVQFSIAAALYITILLAPWPGFVALVFPFLHAPIAAFLVFALAIVMDRFGTLLVFISGDWRCYLAVTSFKVAALLLVYAGVRFWMGSQTLTVVYLAYFVASLAYLSLVASLMTRFKDRYAKL